MHLRQITLNPLFRLVAAATLLFWVAAQTVCAAHCSLGVGRDDSERASCHSPASSESHDEGGNPSSPIHHDSNSCLVLKSALVGGKTAPQAQAEFHLLYALAPLALAFDVTMTEPATLVFRQGWRHDWVFTPEVCTGPANRSHAPPSIG